MSPLKGFLSIAAASILLTVILGVIALNYQKDGEEKAVEKPTVEGSITTVSIPSYLQTCTSCHGSDLSGGIGPNLKTTTLSKEEIVEVLKNGRGAMPGGLAAGNEEKAAEFILSIKE
ncbi:cytochrome c [Microaerobacter geothermalis]|uniref:c-type cytochrome n=1 Tax=Microaerobacter geothermalis TaxID=674972 RepID=UPI001F2F7C27|nr:cytochrome c [Microaerobacter geothermalis]MCF6093634.1 cytochrome c [Microaerobacter geothermalis]